LPSASMEWLTKALACRREGVCMSHQEPVPLGDAAPVRVVCGVGRREMKESIMRGLATDGTGLG
jgi:hypothetical protein